MPIVPNLLPPSTVKFIPFKYPVTSLSKVPHTFRSVCVHKGDKKKPFFVVHSNCRICKTLSIAINVCQFVICLQITWKQRVVNIIELQNATI